MKKPLTILAALALTVAAAPAYAGKPVLTKVQFTETVTCDNEVSSNPDTGMATVQCEPEDLKQYPFLADLTKEQTAKDSYYEFDIARLDDQKLIIVNMHNEAVYSWWGSTGAFAINANGTYTRQWTVNWGTTAYVAACPNKLSFIIKGNEKSTYGEWAYDGKDITHVAGYDNLEDLPPCK